MFLDAGEWLIDILHEHLSELDWLWERRESMLWSPDEDSFSLRKHDEAIAAHTDALVLSEYDGAEVVSDAFAQAEELGLTLATTATLLQMKPDILAETGALGLVVQALESASGERLRGITRGLCLPDAKNPVFERVDALARRPAKLSAAAACEIVAFHRGALDLELLPELLALPEVEARLAAWRSVCLCGQTRSALLKRTMRSLFADLYQQGLSDNEPEVRWTALMAAAWTCQRWLLDHCRTLTSAKSAIDRWHGLWMLALLGDEQDRERLIAAATAPELPPQRFNLLATYGDPRAVDVLLDNLAATDPVVACAAARAFTRLTGQPLPHVRAVPVRPAAPPDNAANTDADDSEDLRLPDAASARQAWRDHQHAFAAGARYCRGVRSGASPAAQLPPHVDLFGRFVALLREHYSSRGPSPMVELRLAGFGVTPKLTPYHEAACTPRPPSKP